MSTISDPVSDQDLLSAALRELELKEDWERASIRALHPAFEGQLAWAGTGLVWKGYSGRDEDEISLAIAGGVIAALVARGWRPREEVDDGEADPA